MKKNYKEILFEIIILMIFATTILFSIITLIEHKEVSIENKILYILKSLCLTLSIIGLPLIIYNANKWTKRKVLKENLSKVDFNKTKDYYRDILTNHTALELSYIDNFEIDYKKDIVATILSLKLKKKIEVKDNYINIIDNNTNNLYESEIYILENIKDGKLILTNDNEIADYVKEEALNNGLIIRNNIKRKEYKGITIEKIMTMEATLMILLTIIFAF